MLLEHDVRQIRDRYVLEAFAGGAVVLDLETGNYFHLNSQAASIFATVAQFGGEGGVPHVQAQLGVSPDIAREWVLAVVSNLRMPAVRSTPAGSYRFRAVGMTYFLELNERRLMSIDRASRSFGLVRDLPLSLEEIELCVRAILPKLLFMYGVTVLHGASCYIGKSLTAFAGASGAGKTTTARAFASRGATLVSEDLIVIPKALGPEVSVTVRGEEKAHQWARRAAETLADGPDALIESGDVCQIAEGETQTLGQVLFVHHQRRRGHEMTVRPLDGPAGLTSLMEATFLGESDRDSWRRYFTASSWISRRLALFEATMPSGIERLQDAASNYMDSRTS